MLDIIICVYLYWFTDQDITFIICGIIGLLMSIIGLFKFYGLKQLINALKLHKESNLKYKIEDRQIRSQMERTKEAIRILRDAKRRLEQINSKNNDNYRKFERIQDEIQRNLRSDNYLHDNESIIDNASNIAQVWKQQNMEYEKETLSKIYDRFIQNIIGAHTTIIKQEQIKEFEKMPN